MPSYQQEQPIQQQQQQQAGTSGSDFQQQEMETAIGSNVIVLRKALGVVV